MRYIILLLVLLISIPSFAQEEKSNELVNNKEIKVKKPKKNIFKQFYNNLFKYRTVYGAGDYRAP